MTTSLKDPSLPYVLLEGKKENFFYKDWYDWDLALGRAGIMRELAGKEREFC